MFRCMLYGVAFTYITKCKSYSYFSALLSRHIRYFVSISIFCSLCFFLHLTLSHFTFYLNSILTGHSTCKAFIFNNNAEGFIYTWDENYSKQNCRHKCRNNSPNVTIIKNAPLLNLNISGINELQFL